MDSEIIFLKEYLELIEKLMKEGYTKEKAKRIADTMIKKEFKKQKQFK